ncbi:hypothetical protein Ga0100231_005220 [Opitutaceae bacterium TAV4]|nr:hypothetical protein Ga0100231_005220 [Opitutaceae bacterium TAV4]
MMGRTTFGTKRLASIWKQNSELKEAMTFETSPRGKSMFWCPGDTFPKRRASLTWNRSYSMLNDMIAPPAGYTTGGGQLGIRVSDIPAPAQTILITDKSELDNIVGAWACHNVRNPTQQLSIVGGAAGPKMHKGKFNYLFADGHVKLLHPNDTIGTGTLANPKGMWTLDAGD